MSGIDFPSLEGYDLPNPDDSVAIETTAGLEEDVDQDMVEDLTFLMILLLKL